MQQQKTNNHTISDGFRAWLHTVITGMTQSLEKDNIYYTKIITPCNQAQTSLSHVTAQIVVVTDNMHASAALIFIDELKIMNHPVTLVEKNEC
jgi:hypothetical protein